MEVTKFIISLKGNLQTKYDKKFSIVEQALKKIIAADKKNNINTSLIYLDDATSIKPFKVKPITLLTDKNCKMCIDELYTKHQPSYITLFGAQDVFPFVMLENLCYAPNEDDDKYIPTDLPYACNNAYSLAIKDFIAPSRVVGRIPDLPGKADTVYVNKVVNTIVLYKPQKINMYDDYFAVSAKVWAKSTTLSLKAMFGNSLRLKTSPPTKANYNKIQLSPLIHFYNLHGTLGFPIYYGQERSNYPEAIHAATLANKIKKGTIVAAECCYGAQLLHPTEEGTSIASMYLKHNAISFVGASTIAYGPADGQGLADIITQYFIINMKKGASAGRAMLEARQQFIIDSAPHLDPYELKTIAQFYLLGDPSLHLINPVIKTLSTNSLINRRKNLTQKSLAINTMVIASNISKKKKTVPNKTLASILKTEGFAAKNTMHFNATAKINKQNPSAKLAISSADFTAFKKVNKPINGVKQIAVLVVKEVNKSILGYRVYLSR
jgi:hypothetical protein